MTVRVLEVRQVKLSKSNSGSALVQQSKQMLDEIVVVEMMKLVMDGAQILLAVGLLEWELLLLC